MGKGARKIAEPVAKNSRGRIEIKVFPRSQLPNGNRKAELEMLLPQVRGDLFVACGIARIPMKDISRAVVAMTAARTAALLIVS